MTKVQNELDETKIIVVSILKHVYETVHISCVILGLHKKVMRNLDCVKSEKTYVVSVI